MSDATLLAKLERESAKVAKLEKWVADQAAQLKAVLLELPAEFSVTFTGDYGAYTRAIVERLQEKQIVLAPLGYERVKSGKTQHGDLYWFPQQETWHHVHDAGVEIGIYQVVIRKKKV